MMKTLAQLNKQECIVLRNQCQEEMNWVEELAAEKTKSEDDLRRQSESSKVENETLTLRIQELEAEVSTLNKQKEAANPASTSSGELEIQGYVLKEQLKE